MSRTLLIVLAVLGFLVFMPAGCGVSSYNRLVGLDQAVQSQWAQVENAYQRRLDLVPNLVETVKGAAAFEKDTFVEVTEARSRAGQVSTGAAAAPNTPEALQKFQAAQDQLTGALSRLMVVVEKYPDLKATQNFRDLQTQLEGTENRIAVERMRFNEAAQAFNTTRQSFPTTLFAGFFGDRFREKGYFKATEGQTVPPRSSSEGALVDPQAFPMWRPCSSHRASRIFVAWLAWLSAGAILFTTLAARADEARIPPPPTAWVTDTAGMLSPAARTSLDARLQAYERQSGHQVVVWIGDTIGTTPLDDFAVRTFQSWKVGRKALDDGLLMVVLARDKKVDIEVGYGLEGRVPDVTAGRVINDVMVPRFRAGDADGAVTQGVTSLLSTIEGHAVASGDAGDGATESGQPAPRPSRGRSLLLGLLGLFFLALLITNPSLATYFLFSIMSGGGGGFGGGGFGGGGGFSGGGGRSGGGGARGSW